MALIIYNPGLERYLTSSTVHKLQSNWIDTEGKIEAYTDFKSTVLGPLLDYWITSTGGPSHRQGTDGATADGTELQQSWT